MVKVFEEDKADEKDEDDIGDILGEECETEENAGKDEIAEEPSVEEEKIREDRERSEDPEERIGVDDLRYADEDR